MRGGAPAWAVANDCQGIFSCSVRHTRAECVALLPDYGSGAEVVPVRIHREPAKDVWLRKEQERERERELRDLERRRVLVEIEGRLASA